MRVKFNRLTGGKHLKLHKIVKMVIKIDGYKSEIVKVSKTNN